MYQNRYWDQLSQELTVLNDVSETLKTLLENNVKELPSNSVTFDSPSDFQERGSTGLSLFLYKVAENPDFKNQESQPADSDKLQYKPLTLDLYYLLTPFAHNRDAELVILSKIMRIFHDNAILSSSSIKTSLVESGNKELRVVLNDISLEQLNNLWSTFPETPYKLSVSYLITPIQIPSERVLKIKRVIQKQTDYFYKKDKDLKEEQKD